MTLDQAVVGPSAPFAITGRAALRAQGVELLDDDQSLPVDVAVQRNSSRTTVAGARVRRVGVPADTSLVDGIRTAAVVVALLHFARWAGRQESVAAIDSALRLGLVRLDAVKEAALRLPPARLNGRVRRAVADADPRCGSLLETLLRLLLVDHGLTSFVAQHVLRDAKGGFVARVDFCFVGARVVVEADGFAFHADRAAYRTDRERLNAVVLMGFQVLRFTWEDVRGRPDYVVGCVEQALGQRAA
jgi:very-short-patch-repair endonuclease